MDSQLKNIRERERRARRLQIKDRNVYRIVNVDGRSFEGIRRDWEKMINTPKVTRRFTELLKQERRTYLGWRIECIVGTI